MLGKNVSNYFSRSHLRAIRALVRHVSFKSFNITDRLGSTASVILKTRHDFDVNSETVPEYNERSFRQITDELRESLTTTHLILFKINQAVIDSKVWQSSEVVKPKFIGHTWTGVFKLTHALPTLVHVNGTLLSKVFIKEGHSFESDQTILDSQLITHKKQLSGLRHGSNEYYWFFDPKYLHFDLSTYITRVNSLKIENLPYNLTTSACGQVVFEAHTGKKLGMKKSPQTATIQCVFDIAKTNDHIFINNMRRMVIQSQLSLKADVIDDLNINSPKSLSF